MHSSEIDCRSVVNFEFTRYTCICRCEYKRARTTNGKIGPVPYQITKFGIVQYTLHEYLEESSDSIYIRNSNR